MKDITSHMIDWNSNTTRIIDKPELKKLAQRKSLDSERREVKIAFRKNAFELIETIAEEISKFKEPGSRFIKMMQNY